MTTLKNFVPIEQPEPAAAPDDGGGEGLLDITVDMADGALRGAEEAVNETSDTAHELGRWLNDNVADLGTVEILPEDGGLVGWKSGTPEQNDLRISEEYTPEVDTTAGRLTQGVSQFMTGFIGASRALKGVAWLRKAGKTRAVLRGTAEGALADFTVFDPYEERLSDFLQDNLGIENAVTNYLAADEDDGFWKGKLKNVLEGAALGVPVDAFMTFLRGYRRAGRAKEAQGSEEAARIMAEEVMPEVEEQIGKQGDLFAPSEAPHFDPNTGHPMPPEKAAELKGKYIPEGQKRAPEDAADTTIRNGRTILGPDPRRPKAGVDIEQFRARLKDEQFLKTAFGGGYGKVLDMDDPTKGRLFNHAYMDGAPDVMSTMNLMADAIDPKALPKSQDFGEIKRAATSFMQDTFKLDKQLAQAAEVSDQMAKLMVAGKVYTQSLAREVGDLALKIEFDAEQGVDVTADDVRLVEMIRRLGEVEANTKRIITGGARTTSAGRLRTKDSLSGEALKQGEITRQLEEQLSNAGGRKAVRKLAKRIAAAEGDPKRLAKIARGTGWGKALDIHNEYWINAILSGPVTHEVNILSTALHTALAPAERMIGAAAQGNKAEAVKAARVYAGLMRYAWDSVKMAGLAFRHGDNVLDTINTYDAPKFALSSENLGLTHPSQRATAKGVSKLRDSTSLAGMADFLGKVVRVPSRFLLAEDEFFKQINYRAYLYAEIAGEAAERGLKGKELKEFLTKRMDEQFDRAAIEGTGTAYRQAGAANQDALHYSRETTFTSELEYGLGKWVQEGVNRMPWLRPVLPFVRTPTNVLRQAWRRTPGLNYLQKQWREDLRSGDPARVAKAKGQLASGAALYSAATIMAAQGMITGGGPRDPAQKALWYENGWQPYSLKVGDKYIPYGRYEPFSTLLALVADTAELSEELEDQDQAASAAGIGIAVLSRNLLNKSYLTGLTELLEMTMEAQKGGEWKMEQYLQRRTASYLPFSSALRQVRQETDPMMREARGYIDTLRNSVPGLSEDLPARRSWITGKPTIMEGFKLSPSPVSTDKEDVVLQELREYQHDFSKPPKKIGNVELTTAQYSRFNALHGTVKIGRYTMYERLEKLFTSRRYRDWKVQDGDAVYESRALRQTRKIIEAYRKAAKAQLLREDEQLRAQVRQDKVNQANVYRGRLKEVQALAQ